VLGVWEGGNPQAYYVGHALIELVSSSISNPLYFPRHHPLARNPSLGFKTFDLFVFLGLWNCIKFQLCLFFGKCAAKVFMRTM
jgi:hypothetical protein